MSSVPDKDWKLFCKLQAELTEKACENMFTQVEEIAKQRRGKEHQSYLNLYQLIKTVDIKITEMFNNPTPHNVFFKLVALKKFGVLSDQQWDMFSAETRERITHNLS